MTILSSKLLTQDYFKKFLILVIKLHNVLCINIKNKNLNNYLDLLRKLHCEKVSYGNFTVKDQGESSKLTNFDIFLP